MSTDERPTSLELGREVLERGRAAYPDVQAVPDALDTIVGDVAALRTTELDHVLADDVFVVCAALTGDSRAQAAVEKRLLVAAQKTGAPHVGELVQRCWIRLFVPDAGPPRVLRYVGAGSLDGLFRVTATRLALNAVRDTRANDTLESALEPESLDAPLDTQLATAELKQVFKDGLAAAVGDLQDDERLVLRLHLVDGLSIDRLSKVLGVHRATAARRLERARNRVASHIHRTMTLQLGDKGVRDSLLRGMRSQLDLSLSRIL